MEEWGKIFNDCLGKDCSEYSDELAVLLISIDQSVKPCMMWDYSSVQPKMLQTLLQTLYMKKLLSSSFAVIQLEMDSFIVNLDAITRNLIGYLTIASTWLVDISKSDPKVASTQVHDTYKGYLCSILQQIGMAGKDVLNRQKENEPSNTTVESNSNNQGGSNCNALFESSCSAASSSCANSACELFNVTLPEAANLSSIFGCLLGYPQVYWWDSEADGRTLSGMPLKVYKFSASCAALSEEDDELELFTFSIPESLKNVLRSSIQQWGNIAHTRVEQAPLFSKASFNCEPVLCLQVAM